MTTRSLKGAPVLVVGAGIMGAGIAQVMAIAGHPVACHDLSPDVLVQARVVTEDDGLLVEARAVSGTLEHKFWVQNFHSDVADLDTLEREIAAAVADVRYDPP